MDDLFGQAVKLKENQVRAERARWLSLPRSVRETLYACFPPSSAADVAAAAAAPARKTRFVNAGIAEIVRVQMGKYRRDAEVGGADLSAVLDMNASLEHCLRVAGALLDEAKQLQLDAGSKKRARDLFSEAAAVFCFVFPLKTDWNKKGFADEDLLFVVPPALPDGPSSTAASASLCAALPTEQVLSHVTKALSGVAICDHHLGDLEESAAVATFVVRHLDAGACLAAYWAARSSTEGPAAGAIETDRAVDLLQRTLRLAESPALPAERREREAKFLPSLRELLGKLRAEKRESDRFGKKLFTKIFESDALAIKNESAAAAAAAASAASLARSGGGGNASRDWVSSWRALENGPVTPQSCHLAAELAQAAAAALFQGVVQMNVGFTSLAALCSGGGSGGIAQTMRSRVRDLGFDPEIVLKSHRQRGEGVSLAAFDGLPAFVERCFATSSAPDARKAPSLVTAALLNPKSGAREVLLEAILDRQIALHWCSPQTVGHALQDDEIVAESAALALRRSGVDGAVEWSPFANGAHRELSAKEMRALLCEMRYSLCF